MDMGAIMKKIWILLIAALIFSASALAGCSNGEEGGEAVKATMPDQAQALAFLSMLPENTQVLVKFESLEKFYENLGVSQNSIMGVALKEKDIRQIQTGLGFNPLNAQAVKQNGFDLEKPFCLAGANMKVKPEDRQEPAFDGFGLLPVADGAAAMKTIRSGFEKNDIAFVDAEKDGLRFIQWDNGIERGCVAVRDQYLYMTINSQSRPQAFLESIIENDDSLTDAKAFRDIASDTDLTRDLVVYCNISDMVEANAKQIEQTAGNHSAQADDTLASLRQYGSAAMTADIGSPDLSVDTTLALADDHEVGKLWSRENVKRDKVLSIAEPAALLLSFGLDVKAYYEMVIEMMPPAPEASAKNRLQAFKEKTGIDIETELLDNLNGSLNLGFYDGASITMFNYNALLTAGVKDEKQMTRLIDKAVKLLPPEKQAMISRQSVGGTEAYVVNPGMVQMYAGVDDHKLLLASGKPIFEKALTGDKNEGFVQNLTDERLKERISGRSNIFYLNMDELLKTVNNFAMFLAEPAGGVQKFKDKLEAAGRFQYVLASSELDQNTIKSLFFVKTRFTQPFFVELAQMIDQFQPDEKGSN